MDILPSVSCDCCTVFVAPAGNSDNYALILAHLRHDFSCIGNSVGAFNGRNDSFCFGKIFKGFYCFFICYGYILGTASVVKVGMLRSDSRIIQPAEIE